MFDLNNNYLDGDYPWSGILEAASFVIQSTYHNLLQYTPRKIVFGHDIDNVNHENPFTIKGGLESRITELDKG